MEFRILSVVDAERAVQELKKLFDDAGDHLFDLEIERTTAAEELIGVTLYKIDARFTALASFCKENDEIKFWTNLHWYLLPVLLHYDMYLIRNFDGVVRRLRRIKLLLKEVVI